MTAPSPVSRIRNALDSGSFAVLVLRVASQTLGAAVLLLALLLHGAHDTGVFILAVTITQVGAMPTGVGFGRTLTRVAGRADVAAGATTRRLGLGACWGSAALATLLGVAVLGGSAPAVLIVLVVFPGTAALSLLQLEAAALRGEGRPVATTVVEGVVPQGAALVSVLVGGFGIEALLCVRSLALVVAAVVIVRPAGRQRSTDGRRLTISSIQSAVVAGTQLLIVRSDLLIVGALLGPAPAARYALIQRAAEVAYWPVAAYLVGAGARFASPGDNSDLGRVMVDERSHLEGARRQSLLVVGVLLAGSVGLGSFDPSLALALAVLVIATLVLIRYGPDMSLLIMRDQTAIVAGIGVVGLAANVASTLTLTALLGMPGAALGTLLSVLVMYSSLQAIALSRLGATASA